MDVATVKAQASGRINDPEGTKRNIIEIATKEFAENGLSGARIDEIAAKTKSSKRMIYYYFGDKEGLYLKVLEEAYSRVVQPRRRLTCRTSPARGAQEARRLYLRPSQQPRGVHPPSDDREHSSRRIPGEIAGDPEAQRHRHRHGQGNLRSRRQKRRFPAGARSNRTPLADQRALLFQRLEPRHVLKDIQARPRVEEVARLAARCGG